MRSLAALSLFLAGCAGARYPDLPVTPEDDPNFQAPEAVILPGMDHDEAEPLKLRPGDVVTLRTISAETLELEGLIVDARGLLHVPLAGDVLVGGLTLSEAEGRVEEALHAFDAVLRANIVIQEPNGHQATVLGAVQDPGRVILYPGTRVADLVAAAGGPIVSTTAEANVAVADLDGARVIRDGEALPVSIPHALRGDPRHNVYARAGDHLYIPGSRGRTITILGEVRSPRMLIYYEGIRLTQAIALSGGLDRDAHRRDVRVVRGPLREPRVYHVSLRALVEGDATDVVLAPGDIVWVTRTGVANIRDVLGAISPLISAGQYLSVALPVSLNN
jgi:polysaccharide export outer membrane protein